MLKVLVRIVAGIALTMATAVPAMATSSCDEVTQQAHRVDGSWTSMSGALAELTPSADGLAWVARDGAELSSVGFATVPTTSGDTTISAAVLLPGAPEGTLPIAGDDDVIVTLTGRPACSDDHGLGDAVLDLSAVEVEEPLQVQVASAPAGGAVVEAPKIVQLPRLCFGFGTYHPI